MSSAQAEAAPASPSRIGPPTSPLVADFPDAAPHLGKISLPPLTRDRPAATDAADDMGGTLSPTGAPSQLRRPSSAVAFQLATDRFDSSESSSLSGGAHASSSSPALTPDLRGGPDGQPAGSQVASPGVPPAGEPLPPAGGFTFKPGAMSAAGRPSADLEAAEGGPFPGATAGVIGVGEVGEADTGSPDLASHYLSWTPAQKRLVVGVAAVTALLQPLAINIYTPALPIIVNDFDTTLEMAMITISAFMAGMAICPLFWGPASDYFGRRLISIISVGLYFSTAVLCGLAWNIETLIAFRVIQAAGSSALMTIGASLIADTHAPDQRGKAMSIYVAGPLIGPLLGAFLGGLLSRHLGWRSVFWFLAAMSVLALVPIVLWLPETVAPENRPKSFPRPWSSFVHLRTPSVLSLLISAAFSYGSYYVIIVSFPVVLFVNYDFDPFLIGLSMLAIGFGTVIGAVTGGRATDVASRGGKPVSFLLVPSIIGGLVSLPSTIGIGWTFAVTGPVAVVIILSIFAGFAFTFPRTSALNYAIEKASRSAGGQNVNGAIAGLANSSSYACGALVSQFAFPLAGTFPTQKIGFGVVISMIALITFLAQVPLVFYSFADLRAYWNASGRAAYSLELSQMGDAADSRGELGAPGAARAQTPRDAFGGQADQFGQFALDHDDADDDDEDDYIFGVVDELSNDYL
ncbi:hypothetical protein H696_01398 [Fonticula alba]|uniref:Major facilitator superfamily (MFS) profile domain-containing protein n=1 Tax=Fonticula alba TaxID=691883 RepID=A0A058ZDH1_FONAL|nr:hypothetical protein H696_01398 [Fonticula alba]KCV71991.1 hypothetical protein H696_01398 [Fonticula alba]|eukprot:XP_009493569.1 hypothetical protein H696_01398 [Fonticula alba]